MLKGNNWLTVLGFLLAGTGILALVLSLIGIQLSFLTWIDSPGRLFGFLTRIFITLVGFILIYLTQTDMQPKDY